MDPSRDFDLIVIGGGPAGSTLATFVAMQGHRVLLLEKEEFPRHQIGESLLPATIHGICPLLGVSDDIKNAGFVRKLGGTFRWGKDPLPWTFNFSLSSRMPAPTSFAYQVERSRFDAILLTNAAKKGVDVRQQCTVTELLSEGERVSGVRVTDRNGESRCFTSAYVADASGNVSQFNGKVGERVYSKFFQNVALYGYFRNGKRLPPPNNGNILSAAFADGWIWYIPLSDELTSVGAVVAKARAPEIRRSPEKAMQTFIDECPLIREYLSTAERITEGQYGQLRMRKDYSYCSTSFWRPGMILVGDAACFIDPVFSSGVHLATYSALLAARSINSCLRYGMDEGRAFAEFEMRYRREFGNFYRFLVAFYDMNQETDSYFWNARKLLNSEEQGNEAFIRLVGGVSTSGEPLFGSTQEWIQAAHSVGNSFQAATADMGCNRQFDQTQLDSAFVASLSREIGQLQRQALTGRAAPESPLWDRGLVPTRDGLHWQDAPKPGTHVASA